MRPLRSWWDKTIFLAGCAVVVIIVRLGLTIVGYSALSRHILGLGARSRATSDELKRIAWGVRAVSRHVPAASCLTQALAGQYLLARLGRASFIRIGIEKKVDRGLRGHAWLISDQRIVLGGSSREMAAYNHMADLGRES